MRGSFSQSAFVGHPVPPLITEDLPPVLPLAWMPTLPSVPLTPTLLCQGTGALLVELISRQPSEASSPGTLSLARGKPIECLPSSLWTRVTGTASFLDFLEKE